MADNTKQSADDTISTDEIASGVAAGAKVQRIKVGQGANGSYDDVHSGNPLRVLDQATVEALEDLAILLAGTMTVSDGSGALTVDGSVAIGSALPAGANNIGQVDPRGNVAHDAADAGNPIKIGARAVTALIAAVANNDRTDLTADKFGRVLALVAPLDQTVSGSIDLTDTTTTDVIAAPGASTALVITNLEVVNGDPTVGTFVEILDDATRKWKGYAGPLGGGFNDHNEKCLFVCTANKAVRAKCLTASSETTVNISGYKMPA